MQLQLVQMNKIIRIVFSATLLDIHSRNVPPRPQAFSLSSAIVQTFSFHAIIQDYNKYIRECICCSIKDKTGNQLYKCWIFK